MTRTPYQVAIRFLGLQEVPGPESDPLVLTMLQLDGDWPKDDAVPWCSAFLNWVFWILALPRSRHLRARSWLEVGEEIPLDQALPGYDVVVFSRGEGKQPGPDVIDAPGHVGLFAGLDGDQVLVLGGNQGDRVSIAPRSRSKLLGVRRVTPKEVQP